MSNLYKIVFNKAFLEQIKEFDKKDREYILNKISLLKGSFRIDSVATLKDMIRGCSYRYRMGDYQVFSMWKKVKLWL